MRATKQVVGKPQVRDTIMRADRMRLYDQYGAMAYGIIRQIVTDAEKAQHVLIDLFSSAQLASLPEPSPKVACAIVRLARMKALESISRQDQQRGPLTSSDDRAPLNDNLPKLVFDLSFNKGIKLEVIAERLEMTYFDVLKTIREYVKSIRTC